MTDVLVCIKRVPDVSGEVLLTDDGLHVDARHVGYTVSPHELCAVELAVQVAAATGGRSTVLTSASADSVEQLRVGVGVGATARSWSRPTRRRWARPTSPTRSPRSSRDAAAGTATSWCCSATTPPTPATSRSASGSATSSPVRS